MKIFKQERVTTNFTTSTTTRHKFAHTQLKEWLATRSNGGNTTKKERKFSKSDHYKKVNKRYGHKKNY